MLGEETLKEIRAKSEILFRILFFMEIRWHLQNFLTY